MNLRTPSQPDRDVVARAAHWYLRLQDRQADDADHADCLRWRHQHATHELAWQRLQALWGRFDGIASPPARSALNTALHSHARSPRRKAALAAGSALVLVLTCATLMNLHRIAPAHLLADHRTGIGEQRSIELPDHSRVVLDAESTVDVHYGPQQRRLVLHRGAVLVDVASDAQRPFIVETAQGSARALGTRSEVRQREDGGVTRITVLESRVQACGPRSTSAAPRCRELAPNQQLDLSVAGPGDIRPVDAASSAAWLRGQLVVDDAPLSEVLATLQTHRFGPLQFEAPALAGIRVSGVLPLHDTDRALDILQDTLPIRLQRPLPWITTIAPD